MNTYDLKIDEDLQAVFSNYHDTELEEWIVREGKPRDPIRITRDNVIIDGHRRYGICKKHGLPYDVEVVDIDSKDEIVLWMNRWQSCRRNVPQWELRLLRGRLALDRITKGAAVRESIRAVAAMSGCGERTVWRDKQLAEHVAKIPAPIAEWMLANEMSAFDISMMATFDVGQQFILFNQHKRRRPLSSAIRKLAVVGEVGRKTAGKSRKPKRKPVRIHGRMANSEKMLRAAHRTVDLLREKVQEIVPLIDEKSDLDDMRYHMRCIQIIMANWARDMGFQPL